MACHQLNLNPTPTNPPPASPGSPSKIPDTLCPGYISTNGEWKLIDKLGEGSFGICFKAEHTTKPGVFAAFKVLKLRGDAQKDRLLTRSFKEEYNVMERIQKKDAYTPKAYGFTSEAGRSCIIMEYFDHNMLTIKGHRLFGFAAIREYAHDIAQSLYAMHFQDVKPDNILVREPHSDPSERTEPFAPIAFLADFGTASWDVCSTVRRDPSLGCDGTAVYTSPECWVLGESQRAPADMWAMGMALLSRWLGYHPLDDFLGRDRSTRGARFCLLMLKEGWLEEAGFLEGMSRDMSSFFSSLLTICPRRRLTAEQALFHPFLTTTRLNRQQHNMLRHGCLLHPLPIPPATVKASVDSDRSILPVSSPTPHPGSRPVSPFHTPTNIERALVDASFKLDSGRLLKGAAVENWSAVQLFVNGPNWDRDYVSEHEEVLAGNAPLRNIENAPWQLNPPIGAVQTSDTPSAGDSEHLMAGRASQSTLRPSEHASQIPAARASPGAPLRPVMNRTTGIKKKAKKPATPKLHGTRAFTRAQELVLVAAAEAAKPAVRRSARIAAKRGTKGEHD
ncbi:uncharacterized protein LAJ45_04641 [Morchella importuna]|uniref:uncharacterized protein n=1 Tax=Morchella importuna TaxID=1174673 RepID=UPI001E8D25A0|nr:uncharacterized protein LAJ45_04641 [Morchella importuna]KAH8151436.1 hypothetical protein LAJ45_04641 [Morchella importuna]